MSVPRKSKKRTWGSGKSAMSLRLSSANAWPSKPSFFNSTRAPSNVLPFGRAIVSPPASPPVIAVLLQRGSPQNQCDDLRRHLRPDNALDTGEIVVNTGSTKMPFLLDCFLHCCSLLPSHLQEESPIRSQDVRTRSNQASYQV